MEPAGMDALEEFLIDFLTYRRNKKRREPEEREPAVAMPSGGDTTALSEIGKGWPHYQAIRLPFYTDEPACESQYHPEAPAPRKDSLKPRGATRQPGASAASAPTQPAAENTIVKQMEPFVRSMTERFGYPATRHEMEHLANQVIAGAMTLPEVNDSMRAREMSPWGRAALLHAVVELMIVLQQHYL